MPDSITYEVQLLKNIDQVVAETGTSSTVVHVTNHGLEVGDMFVNTLRRSMYTRERGCRVVSATNLNADDFEFDGEAIADQTENDTISLFKWTNINSMIKGGTFNLDRKVAGQSTCSFTIITDVNNKVHAGQKIRVIEYFNGTPLVKFFGFITNASLSFPDQGLEVIHIACQCNTATSIAARRTITIDYDISTPAGDIVEDMLNLYLYQDGITLGTINPGALIDDDWKDDCLNIAEVLDHLADISGFQWFIDDQGALNFVQETIIIDSIKNLVDADNALYDGFTDYSNIKIDEDTSYYANKAFFTSSSDGYGNPIIISSHNTLECNRRQNIEGGTGVYGTVLRDNSIEDSLLLPAEANTTTSSIYITAHDQEVGWMIWNKTRGQTRLILTTPNNNYFTIDEIVGQVPGDEIVLFNTANMVLSNGLKRRTVLPTTLTFESGYFDWESGTKLTLQLDRLGYTSDTHWLIESVRLSDVQIHQGVPLRCTVEASLRDNDSFSTMKSVDWIDWNMQR